MNHVASDEMSHAGEAKLSRRFQGVQLRDLVPFLSLLIVVGTFVVLIPGRFATLQNMKLVLQQSAITMTVKVSRARIGMTSTLA